MGALSKNLNMPIKVSHGDQNSKAYIHLQFPDLARLPPMTGPSESDTMNTALIRFKYVLRCLSCVSSRQEVFRRTWT